ncbi:2-oxo acid dehydrogenase subunit E2 [Buchnera aphidicola (Ceratoglyphina bambusae)]|uniref:2-oxo acid dehydrogenase subunit E2 n=1 Tax=Buchnera aphidicola TaxID=9 RepID=UPI0031B890E1
MYNIVKVPDIGEEELEIIEILVKIGDHISKDQGLITIEGEKTSIEIPSKYNGIIKKIFVNVGDKIKTNSEILLLDVNSKEDKNITYTKNYDIKKNKEENFDKKQIYATPMIRRLARKNNINLYDVKSTGLKGRISKKDFENYLKNNERNNLKQNKINSTEKKFNFEKFGNVKKTFLNKIQKVTSRNLEESWSTIPHVTQFDKVDITKLEKFRKNVNLCICLDEKSKLKVTLLPFIVKAIGLALEKFPNFNSSYNQIENVLFLKKYFNIGIVVNSEDGIFIPVIKDVINKSIIDIAEDILVLSEKTRSKNLNINDLNGGNFTISNLGSYGGSYFTPIINHPEVAILGISRYVNENILVNEKLCSRIVMPLSLSYDHRVINGVEAVSFMNFIITKLEKFHKFIIE